MTENLASLFLLRSDVTFLNHGSFGACPRAVFETYQRWQLQLESQPVAFLDPTRGAKWLNARGAGGAGGLSGNSGITSWA